MVKDESASSKNRAPKTKSGTATKNALTTTVSQETQEAIERKMATVKQKTELLLLLNNKVVTNDEKNKMIESINKLDVDRATKAIDKLKKVIEDRQHVEEPHAA